MAEYDPKAGIIGTPGPFPTPVPRCRPLYEVGTKLWDEYNNLCIVLQDHGETIEAALDYDFGWEIRSFHPNDLYGYEDRWRNCQCGMCTGYDD